VQTQLARAEAAEAAEGDEPQRRAASPTKRDVAAADETRVPSTSDESADGATEIAAETDSDDEETVQQKRLAKLRRVQIMLTLASPKQIAPLKTQHPHSIGGRLHAVWASRKLGAHSTPSHGALMCSAELAAEAAAHAETLPAKLGAFLGGAELEMSAHVSRVATLIEAFGWRTGENADDGAPVFDLPAREIYVELRASIDVLHQLANEKARFGNALRTLIDKLEERCARAGCMWMVCVWVGWMWVGWMWVVCKGGVRMGDSRAAVRVGARAACGS
jgi:hypothetical protein